MNISEAKKIVVSVVRSVSEADIEVSDSMPLVGGESHLNSMKLVEVCIALEDVAEDQGFEFDWRSETALSKSRGMFRTILSLSEELSSQSEQPKCQPEYRG